MYSRNKTGFLIYRKHIFCFMLNCSIRDAVYGNLRPVLFPKRRHIRYGHLLCNLCRNTLSHKFHEQSLLTTSYKDMQNTLKLYVSFYHCLLPTHTHARIQLFEHKYFCVSKIKSQWLSIITFVAFQCTLNVRGDKVQPMYVCLILKYYIFLYIIQY